MKPEVLANFLFLVLHEKMTMASVAGAAQIFIGLVISQKKQSLFNRKENHHMFERIKPTDTTIEVALPFYIMSQISNIFYYANIKDKGLTMYDEKFGLALARKKPEIRSQYFDIQKTWHEKWITRYPDVPETDEYITHDKINKKLSYDFETYGYCKTNISEDDIWHLVDTLLYNKESDPDVIRAKENEINVHRKSEAMYGDD